MGRIEKKVAILEVLANATEPMRPSDIGELVGMTALDTGRLLSEMGKSGLTSKPDKTKSFHEITEKGREYMEKPPEEVEGEELERSTEEKHGREAQMRSTEGTTAATTEESTGEATVTIPSQSDLFKGIGEKLGVGTKKGDVRLDAIVYYVQRTADLDKLESVWNALTEMGIANDVKKRWIKLYSQSLPSKEIPEALKEKLEAGFEAEKVGTEAKPGEIPPKAKRFSLIGNEIIGDPEGDLSFKEALQQRAQNLGVPADQASPLATMIEAMKLGPDMATATLAALIPVITSKEPPKHDDSPLIGFMQSQQVAAQNQVQTLQQLVMATMGEKQKAEIDALRAEIRTGQKPPEADQQILALTSKIDNLTLELHKEQMAHMEEAHKADMNSLKDYLGRLEQQIERARDSKSADSKIGLISETMQRGFTELGGIRQDVKPLIESVVTGGGGPMPRQRSPEEKRKLSEGLDRGIAKEKKLTEMENRLFLGKE